MSLINSASKLPSVVIVGRSNVGKSSLFNAIIESRRSLVHKDAGTTRDRLEAKAAWREITFSLVDTGGLDPSKKDPYHDAIIKQAEAAWQKATLVVWVTDVTVGVVPEDEQVFRQLRRGGKPVIMAANKADNMRRRIRARDFDRFGFPVYPVSAGNGSGIGDLLDGITERLKQVTIEEAEPELKLALIGKPNVGKSSLANAMAGEERMIVSPLPHTTRDAQAISVTHKGRAYEIIDTGGIRRHSAAGDDVECLSIGKSRLAIKHADVVALVIDISIPLTSQDKRLGREIEDAGKGLVIVANKWDLVASKDKRVVKHFEDYVTSFFPNLSWAPVIFTSAEEAGGAKKILELARDIKKNLGAELDPKELKNFLAEALKKRAPTIGKGTRRPRLSSLVQTKTNPPTFQIDIPIKTSLADSYRRYLVNGMREVFNLEGVPIALTIKTREAKAGEGTEGQPGRKKRAHGRYVTFQRR